MSSFYSESKFSWSFSVSSSRVKTCVSISRVLSFICHLRSLIPKVIFISIFHELLILLSRRTRILGWFSSFIKVLIISIEHFITGSSNPLSSTISSLVRGTCLFVLSSLWIWSCFLLYSFQEFLSFSF